MPVRSLLSALRLGPAVVTAASPALAAPEGTLLAQGFPHAAPGEDLKV